jgi:hypothetical protein
MSKYGTTLTVLCTTLSEAIRKDDEKEFASNGGLLKEGEGYDISSGLFGANLSEWLRSTAEAVAKKVRPSNRRVITLSPAELQSGLDRVKAAEGLIQQLPPTHDGRNTWLLNYGRGAEALDMRANDAQKRVANGWSQRTLIWDDETECLGGKA